MNCRTGRKRNKKRRVHFEVGCGSGTCRSGHQHSGHSKLHGFVLSTSSSDIILRKSLTQSMFFGFTRYVHTRSYRLPREADRARWTSWMVWSSYQDLRCCSFDTMSLPSSRTVLKWLRQYGSRHHGPDHNTTPFLNVSDVEGSNLGQPVVESSTTIPSTLLRRYTTLTSARYERDGD